MQTSKLERKANKETGREVIAMSIYRNFGRSPSQDTGGGGDASPCPRPSVYTPGRGCCLSPSISVKGTLICCGKGTQVIPHTGGKYSLKCGTTSGGNGGSGKSCTTFKVKSISGNTITADCNVDISCKGGKCPELRRAKPGMLDFGGDIVSASANKVVFANASRLPFPPKIGDQFNVWCSSGCGAGGGSGDSGSGGGGVLDGLTGGGSGFPWGIVLLAGGVVAAIAIFKN